MIGAHPFGAAALNSLAAAAVVIDDGGGTLPPVQPQPLSFYAEMQAVARELLAEFSNASVSIVRRGDPIGNDPYQPGIASVTRYARLAYVGGYPTETIDGARIAATDLRVLIDGQGLSIVPSTSRDSLEINGQAYALRSVSAIPAAGIVAIYILQAGAAQ